MKINLSHYCRSAQSSYFLLTEKRWLLLNSNGMFMWIYTFVVLWKQLMRNYGETATIPQTIILPTKSIIVSLEIFILILGAIFQVQFSYFFSWGYTISKLYYNRIPYYNSIFPPTHPVKVPTCSSSDIQCFPWFPSATWIKFNVGQSIEYSGCISNLFFFF